MSSTFTARVVPSIAAIDAAAWDSCANPPGRSFEEAEGERFNPFITHAFLHALEASGSVGGRSGWTPAHVVVEDARDRMVAAAPCYLKSHSQGEYVFDHAWADAYERAGGDYYPKLQVAVPFTPVTGRRLLVAADAPEGARDALIGALGQLRKQTETSSIHITFPTVEDSERLSKAGFLIRNGEQFHFSCAGFTTFDDFLAALASRKRKAIKRERRDALDGEVTIEPLTGAAIRPEHWDAFFKFYIHTGSRKWGRPYLTRAFFDLIGSTLADRVLLVMARRAGRYIAGAINFIGDDALYGRNWGAIELRPFLHFEVCYYQAIDFALARGLRRIEAGAQGEHKLARGYRPTLTYSAHEFADARLSRAIADYLGHEREAVERTIAHYEEYAPFRRGDGGEQGRNARENLLTPKYDPDNIFAKILRGEMPCVKVYEDDVSLAFMDVMPRADGHTLVIPKAPARTLFEMDPRELARFMPSVQKVGRAVMTGMKAEGLLLQQFNEPASGQQVFHLHFHCLPCWTGVAIRPPGGAFQNAEALKPHADKIIAALAGV